MLGTQFHPEFLAAHPAAPALQGFHRSCEEGRQDTQVTPVGMNMIGIILTH